MGGKTESNQGSVDAVLGAVGDAVARALEGDRCEAPEPFLGSVLTEARRGGRAVVPSLRALQRLLRLAADLERARARLLSLYRGRLALCALVAFGARLGLSQAETNDLVSQPTDLLAIAFALLSALATYLAFGRSLPRSWLAAPTLTSAALGWLRAHALDHPPLDLPCHSHWQTLRARELTRGVDLSPERRHLLEAWAEDCCLDDATALRRAEDRLPLAELLGLGLPLLLVLLAPALGALATSR